MPNGEMPSWEEWNSQLTEEQRQYSLYKTLESINDKLAEREIVCGKRFDKLEKGKKWNTAESLIGGIIGGIITVIGGWTFWKGAGP